MHVPHANLQWLDMPLMFLHRHAIAFFLTNPQDLTMDEPFQSKRAFNIESVHVEQVPHVEGQVALTPFLAHRAAFFCPTQMHDLKTIFPFFLLHLTLNIKELSIHWGGEVGSSSGSAVVGGKVGFAVVGGGVGSVVVGGEVGSVVEGGKVGLAVEGGDVGSIVVGREVGLVVVGGEFGLVVEGCEVGSVVEGDEVGLDVVG